MLSRKSFQFLIALSSFNASIKVLQKTILVTYDVDEIITSYGYQIIPKDIIIENRHFDTNITITNSSVESTGASRKNIVRC